ncbi:hypothetical protein SADUNF_Sadunf11G0123100 [Salix dunnii]|uniref:Pentatricopeptide repeat-containing protein n=1 Tax=Salix dunnii TaxID=1413687 RepID=A0A835MXI4_9ROSI|nr:hypothetical protein SADUNF_Sadunf11G0123100 [Salix dunnii]
MDARFGSIERGYEIFQKMPQRDIGRRYFSQTKHNLGIRRPIGAMNAWQTCWAAGKAEELILSLTE